MKEMDRLVERIHVYVCISYGRKINSKLRQYMLYVQDEEVDIMISIILTKLREEKFVFIAATRRLRINMVGCTCMI